jgi:hypothetical protein
MRIGLLVLVLAGGIGCKQGVGDRCQLRSDCDTGLFCVLPMGASCQTGGTCQPETPSSKVCSSDAECESGLTCKPSQSCTEAGGSVCTGAPDMAAPPPDMATLADLSNGATD